MIWEDLWINRKIGRLVFLIFYSFKFKTYRTKIYQKSDFHIISFKVIFGLCQVNIFKSDNGPYFNHNFFLQQKNRLFSLRCISLCKKSAYLTLLQTLVLSPVIQFLIRVDKLLPGIHFQEPRELSLLHRLFSL